MRSEAENPWDIGLQNERTTLAWSRTALSFVVGGLVVVRFIAHSSTTLAIVFAAVTLPLAVVITWLAWRRYRRGQHRLHGRSPLPDGALPGAVAALAVLVGIIGIVYVLLS
ncbi:putative membrane protein [Saccharopolyspora lacisalsi]|uniref:Putative membrane protein n=1 Tax=Halosaccharopolyspora lacisalsi TaxID=1000566 RepID=A0A839E107_9PSEU|nr:DUF202 domain-containing protein [Halosaccharopolyspora lacisalsi]MBA8825111.1 putative membrane protein [Halosaccharopolyspora lacisalsi]